jgi:uncharacterized protein YidB (DUF937 family)
MEAAISLISNPQIGGLQGLIKAFQDKGLGDIIASWVSTKPNLPISAEQIQSVFGNEQIQAIAQKLGMDSQAASSGLASVLPTVVDKLTPDGAVPEGGMLDKGLAMLKGLISKT